MSHTIELHKVSKYYANEDTVSMGFNRLDLCLDIGEFVAITGESGSGKSTLLNVISGLDTYEEGEMLVCGEDTTAYDTEDYERYRKTYIGNIFQDFNLINSYTVYQNIELVMLLSGKKKSECKETILELIEKVGLAEYEKTKVSKLSGGQKQRVAIARALAKDAPIIVADEPTGNLDSVSAAGVMETLSKVSSDKLVVVVTHNYDQAEPYVTRKLTMHDGRIIEDQNFRRRATSDDNNEYEKDELDYDRSRMRKSSELLLGTRNTFNIFAKFMLLFVVYFFVATAVLSQYASSVNSLHEGEMLGYNQYFSNSNSDRIVIKKADESAMTEEDFKTIEQIPNIATVVRNDTTLDSPVYYVADEMMSQAPLFPVTALDGEELTCGRLPENDYEVVVKVDRHSEGYYFLSENPEAYLNKTLKLTDDYMMEKYEFDKPIKLVGIIIDDSENNLFSSYYGGSRLYASEKVSRRIVLSTMSASSKVVMDMDGNEVSFDYNKSVIRSTKVPKGETYILEDMTYYFKDSKAVGKDVKVDATNRYFNSKGSYEVSKVLTSKNFHSLLGLPKTDYDMYYNCIFINSEDYDALFDKGYFQVSAFMEMETDSENTIEALEKAGYTTLAMKNTLTDVTGGFNGVLQMFAYARLLFEFIILFFIAYGVIKLIMRSRNSYYSTLRILGATKRNTDSILRIELIWMMLIAYGVDMLAVLGVKLGWIANNTLVKTLHFLRPMDYAILGVLLVAMSVLLANRYSKRIFTKSAMKSFRGEV